MYVYDVPIDILSFLFVAVNVSAFCIVGIFFLPTEKNWVTRSSLLLFSLCVAWPLTEFPEWSMVCVPLPDCVHVMISSFFPYLCGCSQWSTLVLLSLYDVCAVLTPCGPLRYIIRSESAEPGAALPALMYRGQYFALGVGDLIFYSVIVGRAIALQGYITAICCSIAIMMVSCCRLPLLSRLVVSMCSLL